MTSRRWLALMVAASIALGACTSVAPPSSPTPAGPEKVQVTDATRGEIQTVLDTQRQALDRRDLAGYQRTFDGERAAFRRCKQETFEITGRTGVQSAPPRVVGVEPYLETYVRAWVDEGPNGLGRQYFRRLDGRWIQSEPTSSEVGAEKKTTVDGIDIEYWEIDDDVIQALGKGTVAARDSVVENQLTEAKRMFGIRFYPTRSVQGIVECLVVGFHLPNQREDKFIRFFRYWFAPDRATLSPTTISFIQHEGLHWAQDQFSPGITARLDWWLTEGWPDFIGRSRSEGYIRSTVCGTQTPEFKQLVDGPRDDLPEFQPEDAVRYYAFANTMIEYLYAQFGADAYKELLVAYKDRIEPHVNYPKVLNVTPEAFYSGWIAFAKKKYC